MLDAVYVWPNSIEVSREILKQIGPCNGNVTLIIDYFRRVYFEWRKA